jgi:hypothetical protein
MDGFAPCPRCRHENPTDNRFCGRCGASLGSGSELVPHRRESSLTVAGRALPAKLKPVGKALAVGAAALAAEALLSRLGRRTDRGRPSLPGVARGSEPAVPGRLVGWGLEEVLVLLDEGVSRSRVLEWRTARWFYATETTDRRG